MTEADTPETSESASDPAGQATHDIPLPEHLKQALAADWEPAPPMPHPARPDGAPYNAKRRAALSERFAGRTVVVPAGPLRPRANDTDYAYRADSSFTWLTGETVEGAVLTLTPSGAGHEATLYINEYAPPGEVEYFTGRARGALWIGNAPTPAQTEEALGIRTRPRTELEQDLAPYRGGDVAVLRGVDPAVDALFPAAAESDSRPPLGQELDELRLVKDEWEVARLREACEITARGFTDVAREIPLVIDKPVRGERWLEGTFWRRARLEGNEVGYTSIVGAGVHGTTLHWWRNNGALRSGDLLLADMGAETDELYTADVTRTFPLAGDWTADQLRVYRAVLEAQTAGVGEVRSGNDFLAAHKAAMWVLADHLHHWGLLSVTADVSCAEDEESPGAGLHRRYTLHGTSHMLGLDVHDCARARESEYRKGRLAPGYVLTVEPGLYFQPNDLTVPRELRGLAVRIEDDILVTDGDPINLSSSLPRDPRDLVAWRDDAQHAPAP